MRNHRAVLVFIGLLSAGCASMFMNGGKLVDKGYAPTVKASYSVSTCKMSDGSTVNGPAGTLFQVVQDESGAGLFERGSDGSGAVMTNRWSDDKGDHYFGWVQSSGWEYVIPKDPGGQATRFVYVGLKTTKEGDVTKPTSPIAGTCPMVASK